MAADAAADAAGEAVDAAAAATEAANAATQAANQATTAADQASTVIELARKADAERLAQQQEEEVLSAEEASLAYDTRVAAAQHEIGQQQELQAQTRQLLAEAAAATDPAVKAAKGRQAAVNMLPGAGTWVKQAAGMALQGTDEDVAEFTDTTLAVAMEQDDRASVGHIAATTKIPAQQQAALEVMDKPIDQVRDWLATRAYPGKADDDRVAVAKIAAEGGPGVKAAASKALDGTAADLAEFLDTGQYKAREDDDRVAVSEAVATGGPEVKAAGQAVLSGPPTGLRPFLESGLHKARQRDANAAAHIAEVNILLQAAYKSAALAQKDAADAQKVAAQARKDAEKATEWATEANESAKRANAYSEQAEKSADQAEESAAEAAESARTARNAAASARQAAQSAARSAQAAQHSAGVARGYAAQADQSAYQAKLSEIAAGKDALAAAKAYGDALTIAAEKLVTELKEQIEQELQEASKPITDQELREELEKRLVTYRHANWGDIKPGETLLVCGSDGAGGMGCITSTYLDRLIAWYVGADEIEKCLTKPDVSCFEGLAMSALHLKLRGLKAPCVKSLSGMSTMSLSTSSDKCKVWDNLEPDDKIIPLEKVPLEKLDDLHEATGRFVYVVLPGGELRVTRLGSIYGHIDLAQGQQVVAAGELKLYQGRIKSIDNRSGHYQPKGAEARAAAEQAFRDAGFDVSDKSYKERW
ncbi:ALF repeat-containing protein [Streptomyces pseudovenezuelae]|uniref:ALF repeat-containing protein n=1 Tax=Streptomyces pseudovenezuelae TaxID=67350 RepID=UPI0038107D39